MFFGASGSALFYCENRGKPENSKFQKVLIERKRSFRIKRMMKISTFPEFRYQIADLLDDLTSERFKKSTKKGKYFFLNPEKYDRTVDR